MTIFKASLFGICLCGFGLFAATGVFAQDAGKSAPHVNVRDLRGRLIDMETLYADGPVIVTFWATWCKPCHLELKALKGIYREYREKGLRIIAVSEDGPTEKARVKQFIRAKKIPFTVAMDNGGAIQNAFQVAGVPAMVVIGKGGRIHAVHSGFAAGDEAALGSEVVRLF